MIEELTVLPVQLDRHVAAAVQVGLNLPPKSNNEGRLADTMAIYRKTDAAAAFQQFSAGADQALIQACCRNHAVSCATFAGQYSGASASRASRGCAP